MEKAEKVHVATLLYSMGKFAKNLFASLQFQSEADSKKYKDVVEKLDNHFIKQRNIIYECACSLELLIK